MRCRGSLARHVFSWVFGSDGGSPNGRVAEREQHASASGGKSEAATRLIRTACSGMI